VGDLPAPQVLDQRPVGLALGAVGAGPGVLLAVRQRRQLLGTAARDDQRAFLEGQMNRQHTVVLNALRDHCMRHNLSSNARLLCDPQRLAASLHEDCTRGGTSRARLANGDRGPLTLSSGSASWPRDRYDLTPPAVDTRQQ